MTTDGSELRRWRKHEGDLALRVRARSYRRFVAWMDRELEILFAHWAHKAAPNARRLQRSSRQPQDSEADSTECT